MVVTDTGTGIPAAELPKIFKRFERVEGAAGRSFEGTGIGLALVQELVNIHGGKITVESEEGSGSRFTVSIPTGSSHLNDAQRRHGAGNVTISERVDAYVNEVMRWIGETGRCRDIGYFDDGGWGGCDFAGTRTRGIKKTCPCGR